MNESRLIAITGDIDSLVIDLLLPIRTSKRINRQVFERLLSHLKELQVLLANESFVPKDLVGLLLHIYVSMVAESAYAREQGPLEIAVGELEECLYRIFGRNFSEPPEGRPEK